MAWFRRVLCLLWTWALAGAFVLSMATPARAGDVRPRELRVCVRPPGVPDDLDRWVHSPGGKVMTERWARQTGNVREITVYVFDRKAPAISATYLPKRFGELKCPPKAAPKKSKPDAARKKKEAAARKKKAAEEAEEEEREAKPRKAVKREGNEREVEKPRVVKETEEAKRARERREEEARKEELRRLRERERPKVLPPKGATAAWPSKVLPEQKHAGATAAWPSNVLPRGKVLPTAGAPPCGAPPPKLAGGKEVAATTGVREPILKELIGYQKAKTAAVEEAHRQKLRALFESIGASEARPFQLMLSSQDALGATFRDVLRDDPLQSELLGILVKKYTPTPCAQAAPPSAPQAATAGPEGVTLAAVSLTDAEAFDELHALIYSRVTAIQEGCNRIVRFNLKDVKTHLLGLVPVLSERLTRAQRVKEAAFKETDATKKAAGLKRAGALYAGAIVVSQLWQLYVNIALITDWADAMGVSSSLTNTPQQNPLAKRLEDFENDSAIVALTQASLDADMPKMAAALPAGTRAYERHVTGLDRWVTSIQRGAVLSKKVIQVADIALIAISIYQVAKMPVVPAGGSQTPPKILGTLPGGVAVGSAVSLPSLARALEAIRKLVVIGALDGALVAGVGSMGGGSGIALPELQRPTSLAVQVSTGTGSGTSTSVPGATGASTRPPYKINPARDPATGRLNPTKTAEPPDAASVYEKSIQGPDGKWYGKNAQGDIYRYHSDNAGTSHFSGSTGGSKPLRKEIIPIEVRRAFGW